MVHKKQKIEINTNDIFNYVVGKTQFDPIEHCIDPTRYEVHEEFIHDSQEGKIIEQEDDFIYFNKEVGKLRAVIQNKETCKKIGRAEIIRICKELEDIAPDIVKLPMPEAPNNFDLDMSSEKQQEMQQNFKDVFGLPSPKWFRNRGDMKE
jgi:hypothetical protein